MGIVCILDSIWFDINSIVFKKKLFRNLKLLILVVCKMKFGILF